MAISYAQVFTGPPFPACLSGDGNAGRRAAAAYDQGEAMPAGTMSCIMARLGVNVLVR